jgi:4-amino-4-deoxy-L-arabinose transferase-like glycosyltransferase
MRKKMKLNKIKRKYYKFAGNSKIIISFLAILTFGLIVPGTEQLGFWESTHSLKKKTSAEIRREKNQTIPTELTRLIQLEQKASTKWPHLPQWIYRGSSRLPFAPEISTRVPSIIFSFLLLSVLLFFSSSFFSRKIMFWSGVVLITTPLFLLGSRTINLELPWFVFSSLFILTSFYIFEKKKLSTAALTFSIIIAFTSLLLSHLSRGLFLGAVFPLCTVLLGELFLIIEH